ncbi:uncharacterized protein METZ01_LOCUS396958 [marine metagenome]|uniref:Uncharacterized protein n=1 Tax=marine metagenome TaxID=408172 RepID=A0A382VC87_9ZZZZ
MEILSITLIGLYVAYFLIVSLDP